MTHLGQRLSALIDGELDGAERDRVLVHLARCESCRGEAIALRTLKRRMNALGNDRADSADSALTHRLIGLARPEHLFRPRSGPAAAGPWPVLAGAAMAADHGREIRPGWYFAAGSVGVLVASLATAAFMAGGAQQTPEPRITPAVYLYTAQHEIDTGVVPATTPGPGDPVGKNPALRTP